MTLKYSLKTYNKDWRLVREVAVPKKAEPALNVIIRLPNKVSLETFHSLSFPVTSQDVPLVEKTLGVKLDIKKDRYVLEVHRD